MDNSKRFIVSVDRGRFLKTFDGTVVESTDCPSYGLLMTYDEAITWVYRLRSRRYPEAAVCFPDGQYATYDRLRDAAYAAREKVDDLPTSHADLDRIPSAEQRRRYKTDANFAERWDSIMAQPRTSPGRRS